jgi:PAS domain S-box-containing protein
MCNVPEGLAGPAAIAGATSGADRLVTDGWLRAILDNAGGVAWVKDLQGRFVFVNRPTCELFGLPAEVMIGRTVFELFPRDAAAGYSANDEAVLQGGAPVEVEEEAVVGGSRRTFLSRKFPIRDASGNVSGIGAMCVDITERKKAEERLRESEDRDRLFLEGVRDYAPVMLDADARVAGWNQAAERLTRYSAAAAIGRHISELCAGDGRAERDLVAAATTGRAESEGWSIRRDGTRFWTKSVLTAIRDSGGGLRGYALVLHDVTEWWRTDRFLRSIVDHALDGIVCIDARGTVESFNTTAERVFGYTAGEVVGNNISMLMAEPHRSAHDSYIKAYLRTGVAKVIGAGREVEGRRKDGTTFPIELAVTEFGLDGEKHFTGLVRDLSTSRRLEEQLRQSQKMEAIGQLAGGIAHDFNNLLTVILGYGEIVSAMTSPDDARRGYISDILHAGSRAADLTRQLLAFSRKQVLELKVVDLNAIIAGTEKMLRRLIGEDVVLVCLHDPRLKRIKVDPGQLEQVIMNLAVNARDAMPSGGRLTIEAQNASPAHLANAGVWKLGPRGGSPAEDPSDGVVLRITDSGSGMSPEVLDHIFEPFFTTKKVGKGTGLGLATVHGIVAQSNGRIAVRSAPGAGTSFTLWFPQVSEEEARAARDSSIPPTGTETVLLVEDEDGVRRIAKLSLEAYGYTVLEASGGAEAIVRARHAAGPIHLLLTDVVMPGMSGRQVAEEIRALLPGIKVLYMTGYTDDAVLRHGLEGTETALLQKPFTVLTLARKVREMLG